MEGAVGWSPPQERIAEHDIWFRLVAVTQIVGRARHAASPGLHRCVLPYGKEAATPDSLEGHPDQLVLQHLAVGYQGTHEKNIADTFYEHMRVLV